ncbi:dihydrofolate reductase family protein [Anoxynatronum buryatiense]|uniref:Dihydrofolate reductase n=1 Tax=Anoxynatronum buryatiense TaxID=489973 RepID=A0AA45WZ59_9CLOT|nr:dihydrofolate reductase family protein [Anoxynatronum buryatiense]SMP70449.1 Dihydrofolate reductase [Anoxynatronum buryatiense]
MKTVFNAAASLDGYIADDRNSLEWLFQLGDPEDTEFDRFYDQVGTIAMGSTTYQWIYDHQVSVSNKPSDAWPYKVPVWVFSNRTMPRIENRDIRFVSGSVEPVHDAMCREAGDKIRWIVGGGDLAAQFYDAGLLNEIIITVASVTLGKGAPVFPRRTDAPLKLLSVKQYGSAFAELHYEIQYVNPSTAVKDQ